MKHLIIDKPQWQSTRQRVLFRSLTALFWVVWIYLWLPILTFSAWLLGVKTGYDEMVVHEGFLALARLVRLYVSTIALLGGALLAWAYYNYIRFRGVERRKAFPRVTVFELSRRYGIAPRMLEQWSYAQRLVVYHDTHGRVTWADTGDSSSYAPGCKWAQPGCASRACPYQIPTGSDDVRRGELTPATP